MKHVTKGSLYVMYLQVHKLSVLEMTYKFDNEIENIL